MKNILEIRNVWKSFTGELNTSNERIPVLKGVSIDIEAKSITALIGGNGAGKTTLLNIINGFLSPDRGTVTYRTSLGNEILNKKKTYQIARLGIGRLFQGTRLFSNLSVKENLLIACSETALEKPFYNLYASKKYNDALDVMNTKIESLLHKLGSHSLLQKLDQNLGSLSYAEQRTLNLISLLLGEYDLVLLDEPTSGMNVDDWEMIEAVIIEMEKSGMSVFLIEHNMEFIKKYVKTCYYMSSGKIIISGDTQEVLNNPLVKKEYLALC